MLDPEIASNVRRRAQIALWADGFVATIADIEDGLCKYRSNDYAVVDENDYAALAPLGIIDEVKL